MTDEKPRLDSFGDGRRSRLNAFGSGYTFFVKFSRVALPLIALVLVGVVISRLYKTPDIPKITDIPKTEQPTPGKVELVQAKYQGKDADGHAYTLTADHAERSLTKPEEVEFTKPQADVTIEGGWLAVHAANGSYNAKTFILELGGGVNVFHDAGYELELQDLRVNINDKTAQTAHPLKAQGSFGLLQAQRLDIAEKGDVVTLGGPVALTLYPEAFSSPAVRQTKGKKG